MVVDTLPPANRPIREVYFPMHPHDSAAKPQAAGRRLTLARGQVFTIPRQSGIRSLRVLRGTIWLTATPGNQDVLLAAPDYFALSPNAPFVLEALADSEVIFLP